MASTKLIDGLYFQFIGEVKVGSGRGKRRQRRSSFASSTHECLDQSASSSVSPPACPQRMARRQTSIIHAFGSAYGTGVRQGEVDKRIVEFFCIEHAFPKDHRLSIILQFHKNTEPQQDGDVPPHSQTLTATRSWSSVSSGNSPILIC